MISYVEHPEANGVVRIIVVDENSGLMGSITLPAMLQTADQADLFTKERDSFDEAGNLLDCGRGTCGIVAHTELECNSRLLGLCLLWRLITFFFMSGILLPCHDRSCKPSGSKRTLGAGPVSMN
jgi:hypothetical protein